MLAKERAWSVALRETLAKTYYGATAPFRLRPSFFIIGAQKSGTSSLFSYLLQHPQMVRTRKEIYFYDRFFSRGHDWYYSHFRFANLESGAITGEASTSYMVYPHTPRRIAHDVPDAKIVAILRNPVDRAFSNYLHEIGRGRESLSFEAALAREDDLTRNEWEKMIADETYFSRDYMYKSYKAKGLYAMHLENWRNYISPEQLLILKSESLFKQPAATMARVCAFLGLRPINWQAVKFTIVNRSSEDLRKIHEPQFSEALRRELHNFFEPHNQRLYESFRLDFRF
jgi:hypothetical protein